MAIKEFDDFFEKLRQHDELKTQMIQEMQDWSKENSSIIKKQYPKVGKLYKLDVKEIVLEKIAKNGEKYPVEKAKGTAKKYDEL